MGCLFITLPLLQVHQYKPYGYKTSVHLYPRLCLRLGLLQMYSLETVSAELGNGQAKSFGLPSRIAVRVSGLTAEISTFSLHNLNTTIWCIVYGYKSHHTLHKFGYKNHQHMTPHESVSRREPMRRGRGRTRALPDPNCRIVECPRMYWKGI